MNYKGAYDSSASYSAGDVVIYSDGVAYEAIQDAVAGITPHEERCWERMNQPLQEVVVMFYETFSGIGTETEKIDNIQAQIAPAYAKTTYTKGAIVTYGGKLYEAKQNIGTAEDWTAAHWQETTVGAMLTALNAAAATIPDNINDEAITLSTATADYLITVDDSGETPELDVTAIEAPAEET